MSMLNWQGWAANWLGWGSAGTVTPPVVTGGGGDRGINLLREEKVEPRIVIPRQAIFSVTTFQSGQEFFAVWSAESEVLASWEFEGSDFALDLEAISEFTFRSSQEQSTEILMSTIALQKHVAIQPYYEPLRSRVEFVIGDNEMHVEFE